MSINNKLLPKAFAENAGSTYRYDIPDTNNTEFTNKATYDKGFPPVTMADIAAGGIPPFGQDMNGILCDLTTAIRYLQAGNLARYDASFATAIGGYLQNAVVSDLDANQYRSLVDNNTAELTDTASWVQIDALEKGVGGTVTAPTNFTGALQQNGSGVITKANIGEQLSEIGVNQTWQDVKSQRAVNVTYTNTTGKPIMLNILVANANATVLYMDIDGVTMPATFNYTSAEERTIHIIIPLNSTYKLNAGSISSWWELR